MMAMPTMAVYSASKFALEGATEALWYEVRPWNIKVSLIQPGFIRSNSFERTRYTELSTRSSVSEQDPYFAHYLHMTNFIRRCMQTASSTSDDVAKVVIRTMQRKNPPLRISGTMDAWLFGAMRRLLPRRLYHAVLYRGLPKIGTWGRR
jgi:short-subunit dehydrogenase